MRSAAAAMPRNPSVGATAGGYTACRLRAGVLCANRASRRAAAALRLGRASTESMAASTRSRPAWSRSCSRSGARSSRLERAEQRDHLLARPGRRSAPRGGATVCGACLAARLGGAPPRARRTRRSTAPTSGLLGAALFRLAARPRPPRPPRRSPPLPPGRPQPAKLRHLLPAPQLLGLARPRRARSARAGSSAGTPPPRARSGRARARRARPGCRRRCSPSFITVSRLVCW